MPKALLKFLLLFGSPISATTHLFSRRFWGTILIDICEQDGLDSHRVGGLTIIGKKEEVALLVPLLKAIERSKYSYLLKDYVWCVDSGSKALARESFYPSLPILLGHLKPVNERLVYKLIIREYLRRGVYGFWTYESAIKKHGARIERLAKKIILSL